MGAICDRHTCDSGGNGGRKGARSVSLMSCDKVTAPRLNRIIGLTPGMRSHDNLRISRIFKFWQVFFDQAGVISRLPRATWQGQAAVRTYVRRAQSKLSWRRLSYTTTASTPPAGSDCGPPGPDAGCPKPAARSPPASHRCPVGGRAPPPRPGLRTVPA